MKKLLQEIVRRTCGYDTYQITANGFDRNDVFNSSSITSFEFADGSTLSMAELLARGGDLQGTNGNDIIQGTNTTDRINGLDGNDMMHSGAGNDTEFAQRKAA